MQKTIICKAKSIYIANNVLVNSRLFLISIEYACRIQFDTRNKMSNYCRTTKIECRTIVK